MAAGVNGDPGVFVLDHVVQEYKPGHEPVPIHDQLKGENSVQDQVARLALVTPMVVQVRLLGRKDACFGLTKLFD